jgi:hypothetical protein
MSKGRSQGHHMLASTVSSQNNAVLDSIHVIAAIEKAGLASLLRSPRKCRRKNRSSFRKPSNEGQLIKGAIISPLSHRLHVNYIR